MNAEINRIIKQYQSGEISRDAANAALEEAGAGYSLEELTDEQRAEKAAQEYREGYIPATEPAKPVQKDVDRSRRWDLVGKPDEERVVMQRTARGKFLVEYDSQGYFTRATKIKGGNENA